MAKIYIVTSGEYSDYCIQAVFSTKKKADEYRQQHGTNFSIEIFDIDEEVKKETKIWSVKMRFDNFKVSECIPGLWGAGWGSHMKDTFEYCLDWGQIGYITLYLEADCMDRAIKIASERIAQIKANKDMLYAKAFTQVQDPYLKYSTSYPTVYYKTGEIMKNLKVMKNIKFKECNVEIAKDQYSNAYQIGRKDGYDEIMSQMSDIIGKCYNTGYKDAMDFALDWLKRNANKYTYNTGGDDEYIPCVGGKCWEDLKQDMEEHLCKRI